MVTLTGLNFGYRKRRVVEGLNLDLRPGAVYGLLGLNGAGKSTLLRLLAGLLFPRSGTIRAFGHDPSRRDPEFLADVFMLSENAHLPDMADREYVLQRAPFYPAFDAGLLERLLGELDVPRDESLAKLSLGERKKFQVAFGLACGTSLLLLDEPTNGMDIPSRGLFRRLLAETLREDRIVVVSTHQARDLEAIVDRILVLHDGGILYDQGVAEASACLRFARQATPPDPESGSLLYSEPAIGGYACVWADPNAGDGPMDLELLFKAAIAEPDAFARLSRKE